MAETVLTSVLRNAGFPDDDIQWFSRLLDGELETNASTWDNMMDLLQEHNFSGLFHAFEGNYSEFSSDSVKPPTLNNLFNFVSLMAQMKIHGVDSFSDFLNQEDLIDDFINGDWPPTMAHDVMHWMERISCPVVGRNGSAKIMQFSACAICSVNVMFGVFDFKSLIQNLTKMENTPADSVLSLEMKRSLVKAAYDVIGDGECVPLARHNPLTVPMNELETLLRKLNLGCSTIYKVIDVVGPRCHFHRLVQCKASINACDDITKSDVATLIKAIVYMETHHYCEACVDKVSDFPVSEFHQWATNYEYVS